MGSTKRWFRNWYWICLLGFVAPLFGCNCDDTGGVGNNSELKASPPTLNFDGKEGETIEKKVLITAVQGLIRIDKISLVSGAPHFSLDKETVPTLPMELEQGKSFSLTVRYKATQGEAPSGKLRLESDATTPTDGVLDVFLLAKVNQQSLTLTPNPVDFGSIDRGSSKVIEVEGKNQGRANLVIQKIVKGDKTSAAFRFPDGLPQTPLTVKPGETFRFKVEYFADTNPIDKGEIQFSCEGNCAPDDLDPNRRKDPYILPLQGTVGTASIEVDPQSIDFGFVASGTEVSKSFKITNRGKATLLISRLGLRKLSSGAFQVPTLLNIEIAPGETKEAPVRFRPTTGDDHQGVVDIESNDPQKPMVSVQLQGKVTAPNIKVTPTILEFGKAPVFRKLSVDITNTGNQPLEIEPVSFAPGTSAEFTFDVPPAKITVAPNSATKLTIVYRPVDQTDDNGKVLIRSNDPDEPLVEVLLRGLGQAPKICDLIPQPSMIQFGLGLLGKANVRDLELYNQGAVDCELKSLTITTEKGGFPPYLGPDVFFLTTKPPTCATGTCNPPLLVPAGNSVKLKVTFQPATEKYSLTGIAPFEGTVFIDAGAVGDAPTRRLVPLNGVATRPCIDVLPDAIDFGLVKTGCGSKKETVEVYNTCPTQLEVTKIGFSAAGANGFVISKAQKTPFIIPSNTSASIELQYRSTAPARKQNAVLEIEHSLPALSPLTVTLAGEGTELSEQTDTFKQPSASMADVLFVIDNSCSMSDEQSSLGNNLKSFIQWATTLQADFQLGVTTTDIAPNGSYQPGQLRGASTKIFTKNTPNLETEFRNAAKVGTNSQSSEAGLEAARLALSPPMTTGPNQGFLRKDASLSIIVLSDEADQSNQTTQFYINFFKGLKGGPRTDQFRFHAVIGYDPSTKQPRCGSSGGSGQQQASSSGRYLALVNASGGIVASICNTAWSSVFRQIGLLTFSQRKEYYLSRPADPSSIVVKVDGSVVAGGANTWSFDVQSNGIFFQTAPTAGATIQVTYKAICF